MINSLLLFLFIVKSVPQDAFLFKSSLMFHKAYYGGSVKIEYFTINTVYAITYATDLGGTAKCYVCHCDITDARRNREITSIY